MEELASLKAGHYFCADRAFEIAEGFTPKMCLGKERFRSIKSARPGGFSFFALLFFFKVRRDTALHHCRYQPSCQLSQTERLGTYTGARAALRSCVEAQVCEHATATTSSLGRGVLMVGNFNNVVNDGRCDVATLDHDGPLGSTMFPSSENCG